jgi:predicted Zn-dependent protease
VLYAKMTSKLVWRRTGNIHHAQSNVRGTSGETIGIGLNITSVYGKSGSSSISRLDDESLRKAVARAEEIAMLALENPEYMPMLSVHRLFN